MTPSRTPDRSHLRLADLKARRHPPMVWLKIPAALFKAIGALAKRLNASKAEVATALLNTGLDRRKARKR